jgi:hypothetical protein
MQKTLTWLDGKKTYIVALALLIVVGLENGLGFDVPGFEAPADWLIIVLNALGLGALRAGVQKSRGF